MTKWLILFSALRPDREPEYDSTTAVILEKDEPTTTSNPKISSLSSESSSDYDVWTDPLESKQCLASMSRSTKVLNEAGKFPEVSCLKFMQKQAFVDIKIEHK